MIFSDFKEATQELEEEIKENGDQVANTIELINIMYSVLKPKLEDLNPHQPWANAEFEDRISLEPRNPGNAWKELPEVWEPMIENQKLEAGLITRRFSYTYSERLTYQLMEALEELRSNPNSREAYLSIWNSTVDPFRLSRRRVPCTLGYQFFIREGKLHLIYLQRSCNFPKHFQDDIYLARKLQEWVADKLEIPPGSFSHWIGSLHIFIQEGTCDKSSEAQTKEG